MDGTDDGRLEGWMPARGMISYFLGRGATGPRGLETSCAFTGVAVVTGCVETCDVSSRCTFKRCLLHQLTLYLNKKLTISGVRSTVSILVAPTVGHVVLDGFSQSLQALVLLM